MNTMNSSYTRLIRRRRGPVRVAGAGRWQETDGGSDGRQSMAASGMGCTLDWINNSASDKESMSISISMLWVY